MRYVPITATWRPEKTETHYGYSVADLKRCAKYGKNKGERVEGWSVMIPRTGSTMDTYMKVLVRTVGGTLDVRNVAI